MAITLAEAKVGMADKVVQSVIDEFRRESFFLDRLTFDDCVSPGTGGSTLTYGYTKLLTPSRAAGRALNTEYTPNEAKRTKAATDLKIFGGSFEVDRVLENTAATSEISFQIKQKVKATRNEIHNTVINGDSATNALDFDGIDKLVTGSDTDITVSGGIDLSTLAKIKSDGDQLVFALKDLLSKIDGKPDMLLMNSHMKDVLGMVAYYMGYKTESEDAFGRKVEGFDGIPMIDVGQYYNGTNSVDIIGIDGTTGVSPIYPVILDLDGLHGVSVTGNKLIRTYLPDMSQPGAVKKGEVEMIMGLALKNSRKAGALRGVKIA